MIFGYLLSILILIDIIAVGVLLTFFFKPDFLLEARLAAGTLIGMLILGSLMLLLSSFLGLNYLGLIIFLIIINLIGIKLLNEKNIANIKYEWQGFKQRFQKWQWKLYFFVVSLFILFFGYLVSQLLTFQNGRYSVQPVHSYGDISLHLSIISSFAFGDNFPPQSPILSETKISYPFFIDFLSAIFVTPLNFRLDMAVALTGIIAMTALIMLLADFALKITGSKLAACLTLILFFFNGGLGFLIFLYDLQNSNLNFFQFIQVMSKDYTALKDLGFFWINVVISMFLPQRSFLLGLPVAILILYIFWEISERFDLKKLAVGVLLTSFLPIIHAHSLIALTPFLIWLVVLMLLKNRKKIIPFFVIGLLGAITIFLLSRLFLQQSENPFALMRYKLGWMAPTGKIIPFYIQNFGFSLLLIPMALFFGLSKKLKLAYFALIGQVWFIIPSLFLLQPWDFDNTKLFIFWYFSSVFIVAYFLSKLILSFNISNIILVSTVVYLLIFSGALDVTRLVYGSGTKYEIYSPQAIKVADFVKNNTKKEAVFLSMDKFDNPVVSLAGRKVVVGYHGWLWTYGLDYSQREQEVRTMLAGQGNQELFDKYHISHVIIFENEQNNYVIDTEYFNRYKMIYNQDGYKIFQI